MRLLNAIIIAISIIFIGWFALSYFNVLCTNLDPDKHLASWNMFVFLTPLF